MTASPTSHDLESPVEHWLDDAALRSIYSSQYWNDLAAERGKEWWIADGSETAYARLRAHLEESGLMEDYRIGEAYVAGMTSSALSVADLASGIGWTSSLLSRLPNVGRVHAVEISQHRLELLFPQAVRMFAGDWTKISRNLGSFYQLKLGQCVARHRLSVIGVSSRGESAALIDRGRPCLAAWRQADLDRGNPHQSLGSGAANCQDAPDAWAADDEFLRAVSAR